MSIQSSIDFGEYNFEEVAIIVLYRKKCVSCRKPGEVIHEIYPKSRNPKTWTKLENRVLLCVSCHILVHSISATASEETLLDHQRKRLYEYHGFHFSDKD